MTEIHAAVPSKLAKEVREAQMRGEEKEVELGHKESKSEVRGKGKERMKITPTASSKSQRAPLVEDEENTRRRGRTAEQESDESDWIPSPKKSPKKVPGSKRENNIFGIRGLDPSVSLEDASKGALPVDSQTGGFVAPEPENTDSFTTVTLKRAAHPPTSFVIPISPNLTTLQQDQSTTGTPESLRSSHESIMQARNQQHPLFKEFSYSWMDPEILHGSGFIENDESRGGMGKRLASKDFEKRSKWEMKCFKKAGCDLKRYNRGDFGPRTGIGRL